MAAGLANGCGTHKEIPWTALAITSSPTARSSSARTAGTSGPILSRCRRSRRTWPTPQHWFEDMDNSDKEWEHLPPRPTTDDLRVEMISSQLKSVPTDADLAAELRAEIAP